MTEPLLEGVRGELIPIYSAAGARNVTPAELDLLEVWEVAAFFGIGLRDEDEGGFAPGAPKIVPFSQGGVDPNLAVRIARHLGQDVPDVQTTSYHPRLGVLN